MNGLQILGLGGQQEEAPKRDIILTAEHIVALAEFTGGIRLHAKDKVGRTDPNPPIGIRAVLGSRHHMVCFYAAQQIPGREAGSWEAIERIVHGDGTVIYDELEEWLERAASHEGGGS